LESKPKVVGVAWVVECAERRSKADDEEFNVDLDVVHVPHFGTRRRRSMLPQPPKILPGNIVDLEGSPGQASSRFESAIESGTSTQGEINILRLAPDLTSDPSSVDLSDLPPLERARRRRTLAKPRGFGS